MKYRLATFDDINLLVSERLRFIEINETDDNYGLIKNNCDTYFKKAFSENTCDVILAEENGRCIGTGIIFYYDSVPSAFNVTGKNAYITSMYVEPEYRCRGIGRNILNELIKLADEKEYKIIMLNASDMGKPMYKKAGFVESCNGMILDKREF